MSITLKLPGVAAHYHYLRVIKSLQIVTYLFQNARDSETLTQNLARIQKMIRQLIVSLINRR